MRPLREEGRKMSDTLWHIVLINSLPEGGITPDYHYAFCRDRAEADQFIKAHKTTRTCAWFAGPLDKGETKPRKKPVGRYWA